MSESLVEKIERLVAEHAQLMVYHDEVTGEAQRQIHRLEAERDAALAVIERVRDLLDFDYQESGAITDLDVHISSIIRTVDTSAVAARDAETRRQGAIDALEHELERQSTDGWLTHSEHGRVQITHSLNALRALAEKEEYPRVEVEEYQAIRPTTHTTPRPDAIAESGGGTIRVPKDARTGKFTDTPFTEGRIEVRDSDG